MSDGILGKMTFNGSFTCSASDQTTLATFDNKYASDNTYIAIFNPYSSYNYHVWVSGDKAYIYNSAATVSLHTTIIFRLSNPIY